MLLLFFLRHDAPELELAAHLPVFNLDELIVAGGHAAVLHKPLEAQVRLKQRHKQRECDEDSLGSTLLLYDTRPEWTSQGSQVQSDATGVVESCWTYPAEAGAQQRKNRWLLLVGWPGNTMGKER